MLLERRISELDGKHVPDETAEAVAHLGNAQCMAAGSAGIYVG